MYVNNNLTKYVVSEGVDSWTTKSQMSAVTLYTAQRGRLTHLQIHK